MVDHGAQTGGGAAKIFLETERLVLRRFIHEDVENLVELDSDPEVMRFINGGMPTPRDVIRDDVLPRFMSYYERFAGYGFWAATERVTGTFLGWFHLRPPEGHTLDEAELGYRLRRHAWGKGYATEGSVALIRKGFTELGVERVFATTMAVNVASRRVMEKAGLRFVRTFHQPWPGPPGSTGSAGSAGSDWGLRAGRRRIRLEQSRMARPRGRVSIACLGTRRHARTTGPAPRRMSPIGYDSGPEGALCSVPPQEHRRSGVRAGCHARVSWRIR